MRPTLPRTLLALGLACLVAATLLDLLVYRGRRPAPPAAAPTTAPATTTAPAPPAATTATSTATAPPPPPTGIYDVHVSPAPFSATISWRTAEPARGHVLYGPAGAAPLLWTAPDALGTVHTATLTGLALDSSYELRLTGVGLEGDELARTLTLRTPPAPGGLAASTAAGALVVGGSPVFPLIAWGQCEDRFPASLAHGINLFAYDSCVGIAGQLQWLAGRALSAGTPTDGADASGPGLVGWFYPDEADGLGLTGATLPVLPDGRVRFLTLTNHFYSVAAPLPGGRGMYPGLIDRADVVGFDLYPLQGWCQPDRFADVERAQRELVRLAGGRPTFQWIEARAMRCPDDPALAVTPATVTAESWLAIVGGAHGLGFFPADWSPEIGEAIGRVARRVRELQLALLAPEVPVTSSNGVVRATARELGGAVYVIAVNSSRTPATAQLGVPGLAGRSLTELGGDRAAPAPDGSLAARFPPLGVRIWVAAPY